MRLFGRKGKPSGAHHKSFPVVESYYAQLQGSLQLPPDCWRNIKRAYAGRAYHNLDHLQEMIGHLDHHVPPKYPDIFGFALLYHDIVYKPTRKDNEARSAASAARQLEIGGRTPSDCIQRCQELIMATREHLPSAQDDGDEALLIDLDLAVLARDPSGYDRYLAAVRREFWMVPGFVFRKARRQFLTTFLDRPSVYHTAYGRTHYEPAARENLWRELREL